MSLFNSKIEGGKSPLNDRFENGKTPLNEKNLNEILEACDVLDTKINDLGEYVDSRGVPGITTKDSVVDKIEFPILATLKMSGSIGLIPPRYDLDMILGVFPNSEGEVVSKNLGILIGSGFHDVSNGRDNIGIGSSIIGGLLSPSGISTINNSILIGNKVVPQGDNQTNQIVIGNNAVGGGSNTITLGDSSITQLRCQATAITALSDERVKEDIESANLDLCYQSVKNLPVSRYKYKNFTGAHLDKNVTGWLAGDVEKIFPKSVSSSDKYFPVLDKDGNEVFEEVESIITEKDESGNKITKTVKSQIKKMFLMQDVKDITMTEALPTLWGAVQSLMAKVENLEVKLMEVNKEHK